MDGYNYSDDYNPSMSQYYDFGNAYDDQSSSVLSQSHRNHSPSAHNVPDPNHSHPVSQHQHSGSHQQSMSQGPDQSSYLHQRHPNSHNESPTALNHQNPQFSAGFSDRVQEYPYQPMFSAEGGNFEYGQNVNSYHQNTFPHTSQNMENPYQTNGTNFSGRPYDYYLQSEYPPHNNDNEDAKTNLAGPNVSDSMLKRKISVQTGKKFKKENIRPIKPIRQNSNPNIPKRKPKPQLIKSYSYSIDSNKEAKKPVDNPGSRNPSEKSQIPKSLFDFKRKPNFHLNLDNLKNSSVHSLEQQPIDSPASITGNSQLKIGDHDLHFDNEFNSDLTPNMKPPGTNNNDYFEDYLIPTSFDNNNSNINLPNSLGGTNAEDNDDLTGFNFNLYEKDYGEYHNDEKPNINIEVEDDFPNVNRGNLSDQNGSDYEFNDNPLEFPGPGGYDNNLIYKDDDLLNVNKFSPLMYNKEKEASYESDNRYDTGDNGTKEDSTLAYPNMGSDKKSPLTPVSNSPNSQVNFSNGSNNGISPHLYKTSSNQSLSSTNSAGSTKEKPKKKTPKGALCSICGKYISRDLSRHLRIHDDVGRFRCVYPTICSHKTGKFNRPYDYKKHLLHVHFDFDDPVGRSANNLTDKLPIMGKCKACKFTSTANDWLENHVLTNDEKKRCQYVERDSVPPETKSHDAKELAY